ncbi:50S ribosomal protein L9 [Paracoccus sp. YIM 132242]|uniref:Large ribosomal subunit protein bL9 n=1 Tax=Paracoccus lichenicola TaxID=2665644 RepID=A0A6L6HNZ7_9RHOB|nr:50S ribosomal protein L9 [Paracoccus lichenicola]MTE00179.1 50S ribosomal protein L9 [Paracoccus lichenicola]
MQVILLERVAKLGQMGEVVNVKQGFARNFLLPQGKALRASDANIKAFEGRKVQLEAQNAESKAEAQKIADTLDGQTFVVIRSASDAGALYGSVTTRDAADAATEAGFTLDRKQVVLIQPIKELGLHEVSVVLHPEVNATIVLNVARSAEEAELQAQGKSIQDLAAEADAAAEFEIAELFDDIGAANDEDSDDRN